MPHRTKFMKLLPCPKMFFYARPHLFPLPQERTLLRTIFKHLDAGRANNADGEWEVRRRTIRLLLGEKAGMRAVLKTNRRTAPTLHRPIPVLARARKKVVISINETGAGGFGLFGDCPKRGQKEKGVSPKGVTH
jgi:hypothetical protein